MQSVLVSLPKKECFDHRTISLIAHASKILLKILTQRLESKVKPFNFVKDDKFGFRKGRGTRDAIGVLRWLGERSLQHNKDLFICFVDYEKAFELVNWCKLLDTLNKIGVDNRDRFADD